MTKPTPETVLSATGLMLLLAGMGYALATCDTVEGNQQRIFDAEQCAEACGFGNVQRYGYDYGRRPFCECVDDPVDFD
jgi:hypothetical protein